MPRQNPPTGSEIAEKARQLRFDHNKSVEKTRDKDKAHVRFTQALFERQITKHEIEDGIVLGRVEADPGESRTKLRPGKYHLFLSKVGDTWKGYAELNGEIAIEAKRVEVKEGTETRDISDVKPTIEFGSICFTACITVLIPVPFWPYEIPVPYCWVWCI